MSNVNSCAHCGGPVSLECPCPCRPACRVVEIGGAGWLGPDPRDAEIARLKAALAEQTAERVRFRKMVDEDRYALADALDLKEWHWPEPIAVARQLQRDRRELVLIAYYEKVALVEKLLAGAALRGETP